ncbi:hypothetical protein D3C76_1464940 [compost metagenome]
MSPRLPALLALPLFGGYTLYVMTIREQPLKEFGAQLMGRGLAYLLPFYLLTAVFASIGPLLYLVLRKANREEA